MIQEPKKKALIPVDFKSLSNKIPELKNLNCKIDFHSSAKPIDSSNLQPSVWEELASVIEKKYNAYTGFVVLHGTDTMAYTASALSFMLHHLSKPIILTGSQLPLGVIRTDAKRNLITAIEIATGNEIVPEVCIYFNSLLFRGNRAEKFSSSKFDAFHSLNYPVLAEAGVTIQYNHKAIRKATSGKFYVEKGFNTDIALVKLFPGINASLISALADKKGLRAIVLETFGSGNAPTDEPFLLAIEKAIGRGIIVLNISQCSGGSVTQGTYETSLHLKKLGVVSGGDMTTEAAVTKLMFLLNKKYTPQQLKERMLDNLCGERSV